MARNGTTGQTIICSKSCFQKLATRLHIYCSFISSTVKYLPQFLLTMENFAHLYSVAFEVLHLVLMTAFQLYINLQ